MGWKSFKTCWQCLEDVEHVNNANGKFVCDNCYGRKFKVVHPSIDIENLKERGNNG